MMNTIAELQAQRIRIVGVASVAYLMLVGLVMWLWLRRSGVETTPIVVILCALPAVLSTGLALTSTEDQRQYLARVLACAGFVPVLLLFWGTSLSPAVADPNRAVWPFGVCAAIGHALVFVGGIFVGGSFVTTVPASPGVAVASSTELVARIRSLEGAALGVSSPEPRRLVVLLLKEATENRSHEVKLQLDEVRHVVQVREKVSASGARPRTASEASMRGPGDSSYNPTRPNATRVSETTFQTTMIVPSRLAQVPLRVHLDRVEVPEEFLRGLDGDGMMTLLCAVATQSGWRWQPVFLNSNAD